LSILEDSTNEPSSTYPPLAVEIGVNARHNQGKRKLPGGHGSFIVAANPCTARGARYRGRRRQLLLLWLLLLLLLQQKLLLLLQKLLLLLLLELLLLLRRQPSCIATW
jgi:hypothetical protein